MYRFKSWSLLLPFCAFFNGKIYFTSSCSDLKSKEKPSWSAGQFPQRTSTTKHQAHAAHSVPPYAHLPPRTREQSSLWLPPQPILTLCKALPACTRAQVGTWYLSPWLQQKRCSQLARRRVSCWLSTSVCSSSAGQDARQQQDLGGGQFMKQTRGPWDGFCGSLNKAWGGCSTATWKGLSSTEATFCCSCGHSFLGNSLENALSSTDKLLCYQCLAKHLEKACPLSGAPLKSANSSWLIPSQETKQR